MKKFIEPEMEKIVIEGRDVIVTSGGQGCNPNCGVCSQDCQTGVQ